MAVVTDEITTKRCHVSWWRRAGGYLLRIVVPVSLLSQLAGTLITGRSSPGGLGGTLILSGSFLVIVLVCNLTAAHGQSWAHRFLGLQVCSGDTGLPVGVWRLVFRDIAHLADWASLGIGFLLPLFDPCRRTFADLIAGTIVIRTVVREPSNIRPVQGGIR